MEKGELVREIERLKEERNAIIMAHNYQLPEVQDVADFLGDSLELARKAVNVDADVIVFAGVDFMAETARSSTRTRPSFYRQSGPPAPWPTC